MSLQLCVRGRRRKGGREGEGEGEGEEGGGGGGRRKRGGERRGERERRGEGEEGGGGGGRLLEVFPRVDMKGDSPQTRGSL